MKLHPPTDTRYKNSEEKIFVKFRNKYGDIHCEMGYADDFGDEEHEQIEIWYTCGEYAFYTKEDTMLGWLFESEVIEMTETESKTPIDWHGCVVRDMPHYDMDFNSDMYSINTMEEME